ncbi:IclR family transcriptional regulator [Shimia sediminis]|uniref:IclR family transcriptional regulator n=1 Tax=Shimia sediminis TaxID=2497945 RepID=UPI000F8C3399|nr:IclR family transcriptional regulator [Shimia sediminis]
MPDTGRDMRFSSTLARGLAVLRAFRPSDDGLGNQDISKRTGIPKPTVCRLTHTLCADGYLTQGKRNDKYRLGPAALALGQIAGASFTFIDEATPHMQALANRTGALIGIAIQDSVQMLMSKTWTPDDIGRDWMEVGYRMPVLSSSSGRAYLAGLHPEGLAIFTKLMKDSQASEIILAREHAMDEVRKSGFTCVSGEARYSQNITAVAVPFWPVGMDAPVAFLAGSAASVIDEHDMRVRIGPALVEAVQKLRSGGKKGTIAKSPSSTLL